MKRIIKRFLTIITVIITLLCIFKTSTIRASSDLDYINLYEVVVDPRNDGTLDISIHLNWEVLDSTSEGPLEWVIKTHAKGAYKTPPRVSFSM